MGRGGGRNIGRMSESRRVPAASAEICAQVRAACAGGALELPTLPAVAQEVLALCQAEDVDARRLSAVLHRDPSLASHVMRVANSPLHAPGVPIVSLQQAISRIGLRAVSEAALAVAVRQSLFGPGPAMAALWRHSFATALLAKEIARHRRRNVESSFLCGLLHDLGRVVVGDLLSTSDRFAGTATAPDELAIACDVLHTEVGAEVARQWRMPPQVEAAIRGHHDWLHADSCADEVQTVHLADELAHLLVPTPLRAVTESDVRGLSVLEELSLYPDDVDLLLRKGPDVLAATQELT